MVNERDFQRMKDGELLWTQVEGFDDECKWWLINNEKYSTFFRNIELMNDEMLKTLIVNKGCSDFFSLAMVTDDESEKKSIIDRIKGLNLTENEWLTALKNFTNYNTEPILLSSFYMMVYECADMTNEIAVTLCNIVIFLINDKRIEPYLKESDKENIFDNYINKVINNTNGSVGLDLNNDIPISEKTWNIIEKNLDKLNSSLSKDLLNHKDCPTSIHHMYIAKDKYLHDLKILTAEEVIYWFDLYHNQNLSSIITDIVCDDWGSVVRERPDIFKLLKNPNATVCKIAVEVDANNYFLCKKPSKKLTDFAIKCHPELKRKIENKNIKEKQAYTSPYYLVKFMEDLCDEGYLVCSKIIKGKDMKSFMDKTFCVIFGNLYDDTDRKVKDCVEVIPLTEEKANLLFELGFDNFGDGNFIFEDE